ncbi:hypothetical protein [Streptomyces sp. NPDC002644]
MTDQFGNEIREGDVVVSAATSTGNLKIGKAYFSKSGNLMIEHITEAGWYWLKRKWNDETKKYEDRGTPLKTPAGSNVLLLRRADGSLTDVMHMLLQPTEPPF